MAPGIILQDLKPSISVRLICRRLPSETGSRHGSARSIRDSPYTSWEEPWRLLASILELHSIQNEEHHCAQCPTSQPHPKGLHHDCSCGYHPLAIDFPGQSRSVPSGNTVKREPLVVGGSESAVAAAVQAARSGVQQIVLVNDIAWLGGQFSSEAVGAIDDWTMYRGRRVDFPESGLFLEVIRRIRQYNSRVYGLSNPGNSFCATDTIRPACRG